MIVEDRVLGGLYTKSFISDDIIDIMVGSMGMDKKPISLGGGYMHIRKNLSFKFKIKNENNDSESSDVTITDAELFNSMKNRMLKYPKETNFGRLINISKRIPTYLMFNYHLALFIVRICFKIINLFGQKLDYYIFSKFYRKANPGFEHVGYLKNPS